MSEGALRIAVLVVAAVNLATGLFAAIAPGTFFEEVGPYGARNGHYVGDIASFYLAAGLGVAIAARRASWRFPVLAVVAVWWALHALNHLGDVGEATSDAKGAVDTILIALGAAAIGYLAWVSAKRQVE
jgi:hypothetical protein